MHWSQFLNFLVSMLAITNPAGSLAVFLSATAKKSVAEKKRIALTATLAIIIVLILITWTGTPILAMFGISLPAFEITGGIILMMRGLVMLHSEETPASQNAKDLHEDKAKDSIAVVPLAIPIIAGPGAITTAIIYTRHFAGLIDKIYISLGILIVALIVGCALYFSSKISQFLGPTGIKVITRIMGLILAAIAMSMITTGIQEVFPRLVA